MARGKHSRRKANKDNAAELAEIESLTAELAHERKLLDAAENRARAAEELRAAITATKAATDHALSGYAARLRAELTTTDAKARAAGSALAVLDQQWKLLTQRYLDRAPGPTRREQLEQLMRAIGLSGYLSDDPLGLSTDRVLRLQALRGQRSRQNITHHTPHNVTTESTQAAGPVAHADAKDAATPNHSAGGSAGTAGDVLAGLYRPVLDANPTLSKRRDRAAASTPWTTHRDSQALWWPTLLTTWEPHEPFDWLPNDLGALTASDDLLCSPLDRLAHDALVRGELAEEARRDTALHRATGRMLHPWDAQPRFSRPGDAALLRHHYATSAMGTWLRTAERPMPADHDIDDEATWAPPPTTITGALARTARAMRTAVPFWLPPGQTHGYADSEPLRGIDLDLMRMPFEATLLTLADPLRLAPARTTNPSNNLKEWRTNQTHLVGKPTYDAVDILGCVTPPPAQYGDQPATGQLPTIADVFDQYGAWIEGLLFLAKDNGELLDRFAWLLAIDSHQPQHITARIAVPAERSACSAPLQALVLNLAAVPAWGDWHAPEAPISPPARSDSATLDHEFAEAERRGAAAGVRVLNLSRTPGARTDTPTAPTGRPVTPHMRRGHWRRQHHGAGRTLTKMVRVPPTLVNAGRFIDVTPRVYTVPLADLAPTSGAARPTGSNHHDPHERQDLHT